MSRSCHRHGGWLREKRSVFVREGLGLPGSIRVIGALDDAELVGPLMRGGSAELVRPLHDHAPTVIAENQRFSAAGVRRIAGARLDIAIGNIGCLNKSVRMGQHPRILGGRCEGDVRISAHGIIFRGKVSFDGALAISITDPGTGGRPVARIRCRFHARTADPGIRRFVGIGRWAGIAVIDRF